MLHTKRTFPFEYSLEEADVCLLGIPFDSTGIGFTTRHGPTLVREAIKNLIGYDPALKVNALAKLGFHDAGDIEVCPGSWEITAAAIADTVKELFKKNPKIFPVFLGGEHLITLGILEALPFKKISVLHFDAHADLKDEWMGNKFSHITWGRRALAMRNKDITITQIGIRAFDGDEADAMKRLKKDDGKSPVYITVDMDVFDPAVAPEVGTPEPLGMKPRDFFSRLEELCANRKVVGLDIVECGGVSLGSTTALLAANVFRKVMGLKAK